MINDDLWYIKVYGFFENSELDVVAIDNLAVVQARSSSSTIESSSVTTSTEACSSTEWQTTQSLISSSKASQTEPSSLTSLPTTLATSTRSTVPTPSPNSKCPYQEDYSPCVCKKEEQGGNSDDAIYDVSCEGASLEEIIQVFNRTTPTDFNHFTVVTNETTIPNHLMQSSWAIEVALNCMNGELEQIEPDAFNSSRHSMVKLEMIDCSIGKVDFVFSFVMVFRNCSGLFSSWFSLPRLHYLTSLTLEGITESNETISFPSNLRKIVSFNVTNSDLNESTINSLMYWLASSFGGILGYVTLSGNQMHALPPLFANNSFPELIRLTVNNNPLQILESNTLIVTSYFTEANFENCELEVLRPRFISGTPLFFLLFKCCNSIILIFIDII